MTQNVEKSERPVATVLIVEDEAHMAAAMQYSLEQEHYAVEVAHDGPSALERITQTPNHFDLVILDIMLPGMSGYTVCEKIRKEGNWIPILFLSARTLPEDRAKGFNVGGNQYLSKPFELEEFLSRIRNLLNQQQHHQESANPKTEGAPVVFGSVMETLDFGNVHVNFLLLEAIIGNTKTRLTSLEVALLRYFAEHPNRVISKDELLKNVWKTSGGLNTRAPDQFLLRLRKIFEPDPAKPIYFLTYRNTGYLFKMDSALEET